MLVLALLRKFREAAYIEGPLQRDGEVIFRESRPARYFYAFGISFVAVIGALSFLVKDIEWYIRAAYIPLFALLFTRWPWAVKMDDRGISRRSYFGVLRTIQWANVTALDFDRKSGRFTVCAEPGMKIRCAAFMVSPAIFFHDVYCRAPQLGPMPRSNLTDVASVEIERGHQSDV